VRQAQADDRAAFGVLYERFSRYVHGILLARLPADEASDLVQDVFLQAMERLGTLREPRAFAGWLATIARNRATDALRVRPVTEPLDEQRAGPPASPEARADAQRALAAVQRLPEAYRETLVLRLVEGLTGPEIARLTGLTPDSVRVNLHRGFKLLRELLGGAP
jgi:RNA polymerase sigma-70 factor (ECF subfamily)